MQVQFLLYCTVLISVPGNTTIDFPADVAIQLSTHPNIVYLLFQVADASPVPIILYSVDQCSW